MIRIYRKLLFLNDNNRSILRFCLLQMDFHFLFKSIFNVDYYFLCYSSYASRHFYLLHSISDCCVFSFNESRQLRAVRLQPIHQIGAMCQCNLLNYQATLVPIHLFSLSSLFCLPCLFAYWNQFQLHSTEALRPENVGLKSCSDFFSSALPSWLFVH